ncbi:MAG TPA: hypothetical protein VKP30_33015, partial [Polyangiaceae bacterium]|nr:hypothetical protein [Polyangiaceae bacterium]
VRGHRGCHEIAFDRAALKVVGVREFVVERYVAAGGEKWVIAAIRARHVHLHARRHDVFGTYAGAVGDQDLTLVIIEDVAPKDGSSFVGMGTFVRQLQRYDGGSMRWGGVCDRV